MEDIDNTTIDGVVEKVAETTAPLQRVVGKPFPKGVSGNPAGRPKGSKSIKDTIRKMFEEEPEKFTGFIHALLDEEKSLVWQMLEGKPTQTIAGDNDNPIRIITVDKDLAEIHGITTSDTEDNSKGQESI